MAEPPLNPNSSNGSSTKNCDYCGKENAIAELACGGCGTPFPIPTASTPEDPSPTEAGSPDLPAELNARSATFILVIWIAVQVLFLAAGATIGELTAQTSQRPRGRDALVQKITPPITVAAMLGGAVTMLLASRGKIRASLTDRSPVGAAWTLGSPGQIATGAALGTLVALGFLVLGRIPGLRPIHITPGPFTRMAMTPGLARIVWLTTAVLLAPPFEELVFRGVLYGGYRRSFGPARAALLTTLIFCGLHMTEVVRFPLAAFAIAAMAVAALWMRLRSSAVGPAVAVHLFYNGVIALVQVIAWLARK